MALLSALNPTLLDVTKALAPDGSIDAIAEILNETNEILDDMTFIEGNLATGHRTTIRTGIPTPTWRQIYGGVQPGKSSRAQVQDSIGMLEAYAEIDKALADLNGNTAAFRLQEEKAWIEGMSQAAADNLFLGDERQTPERFTGFAPRFSTVNTSTAANAENVIDGGGVGSNNASIWLVGWGPNTVHGIYPKGSQAGLQMEDKGQVTTENIDGSGGRAEIYRSHYTWKLGLTVRDWRFVVRICNIDRTLLSTNMATGANLADLMFRATELVPNLSGARFAFYMDRNVRTKLRQQMAYSVTQSTLTTEMVGGKRITTFDEIPIRRCDALMITEARVV